MSFMLLLSPLEEFVGLIDEDPWICWMLSLLNKDHPILSFLLMDSSHQLSNNETKLAVMQDNWLKMVARFTL